MSARMTTPRRRTLRTQKPKLGHDPVSELPLSLLRPSPENDKLYRPVDHDDPAIQELAASIARLGVKEPLVVTIDGFILSGHRRYCAARLAGLKTVPVRIEQIRRTDDIDAFVALLATYNQQREKSFDEKVRENIARADQSNAYEELIQHRIERSAVNVDAIEIVGTKTRCAISTAKEPFLQAVCDIINKLRAHWPLSDRRIHYKLLDDPPLRHASKPDSTYANDRESYKSLVDLLTRGRLAGNIPMCAIADETRPVTLWDVHREPGTFIQQEVDGFLKDYWRDLMQSQPNHLELIGEKNTIAPVLRPIAAEYTIPLTIIRGYSSLPPRHAIAQRYKKSGKEKLILLMNSDNDPDGDEIAHSFARSMRDDFGITNIEAIRVALTAEQVKERNLPPVMIAKGTGKKRDKFVKVNGQHVWELDALDPEDLQALNRAAIDSVIDVDAFNREVERQKTDAASLQGVRRTMHDALAGIDLTGTQ